MQAVYGMTAQFEDSSSVSDGSSQSYMLCCYQVSKIRKMQYFPSVGQALSIAAARSCKAYERHNDGPTWLRGEIEILALQWLLTVIDLFLEADLVLMKLIKQ